MCVPGSDTLMAKEPVAGVSCHTYILTKIQTPPFAIPKKKKKSIENLIHSLMVLKYTSCLYICSFSTGFFLSQVVPSPFS